MALRKLRRGKQGARQYYEFCYFEGEIVKELRSRGLFLPTGRMWSWAAIRIIVTRFKDGLVKIEDVGSD